VALFPSSRSQGTVAAPKSFPTGLLLLGIAVLLVLWGLGAFFLAARRHAQVAAQPVAAPPAPPMPALSEEGMLLPERAAPSAPAFPVPPPAPASPRIALPGNATQIPIATATPDADAPQDACSHAIAEAGIKLPADFQVLAAGAYRGRDLEYSIGRNGHRASQIDVVVNSPGKPIALMLGAYDPTVWNLSWTSGTRIVAVYVGGYEPQQLAGLGSRVPTIISSYEQKAPCPYFYLGGEGLGTVNPAARRVFGKAVDMVYPAGKDGTVYVGPGGAPAGFSFPRKPTPEPEPKNTLYGEQGLEFAIQMGQLRRATAADAELWARAQPRRDVPPVAGQASAQPVAPPSNVYIVQSREFVFPDGLYGAHAVIFVVPSGIPRPRGNPGHSAVYEVAR
jgi:hypothetical protein